MPIQLTEYAGRRGVICADETPVSVITVKQHSGA